MGVCFLLTLHPYLFLPVRGYHCESHELSRKQEGFTFWLIEVV